MRKGGGGVGGRDAWPPFEGKNIVILFFYLTIRIQVNRTHLLFLTPFHLENRCCMPLYMHCACIAMHLLVIERKAVVMSDQESAIIGNKYDALFCSLSLVQVRFHIPYLNVVSIYFYVKSMVLYSCEWEGGGQEVCFQQQLFQGSFYAMSHSILVPQ